MLYCTSVWAVKTIVPEVTEHVGWVTEAVVGAVGAAGWAGTEKFEIAEIHVLSETLRTLNACEPEDNPAKVADA